MTIDGLPVSKVLRPESVEDLAEALSAEKGSIVPVGAATFSNALAIVAKVYRAAGELGDRA